MTPHNKNTVRQGILDYAFSEICSQPNDESEVLIALAELHLGQSAQSDSPVTKMFARARSAREAPRLDQFIHWLFSREKIARPKTLIADMVKSAPNSRGAFASQGDAGELHMSLRKLSISPWSDSIGLALNETDPESACRWPFVAALSGAEPLLVKKLTAIAAPLLDPAERDQALVMGAMLRDEQLLSMALSSAAATPPSEDAFAACAKDLATRHPQNSMRAAAGIDKRPALEAGAIAAMILQKHPNKNFANKLLAGACLENLLFPENLSVPEWLPAKAVFSAQGARLSRESFIAIAEKASALWAQQDSSSSYYSGKTTMGGRSLSVKELDDLAFCAIKKSLSMGSSPDDEPLSASNPPLAFMLMELLPKCGPKTRQAIITAMDDWSKRGFGREQISWIRGISGHTQSIGSAIASLPRQKPTATGKSLNFEKEMCSWLHALASQGFNFDAKATPKSKSLGERLRGTASFAAVWTQVESSLISGASPAGAAPRKKSLAL